MKATTILAVTLFLAVGCSYNMGTDWEVAGTRYLGETEYRVGNYTDGKADPPRLVFRIEQSVSPDTIKQEQMEEMQRSVPYRFGAETANFVVGVGNIVLTPIAVPLILIFPSEESTVGGYFAATGNNLNFFKANPDIVDTPFRTPMERVPTGNKKAGRQVPIERRAYVPLDRIEVTVSVPELELTRTVTTDAIGYLEIDLSSVAGKIEKHKTYSVKIGIAERQIEQTVSFGK